MKRVVSIALIAPALLGLVAFVFVYLSLSNKQGQLNDQLTSLELELKTGAEKYARCYYSVNNGNYMVSDVSLSHLRYDSTDAEKAQLDKIESDFMNNVKKQCDGVIANYETKHAEYEKTLHDFAASGWVSLLIGGNQAGDPQIDNLEALRFKTGDALTFFTFTKQDVEKYFDQRLANG